jgi:hypothetical protein
LNSPTEDGFSFGVFRMNNDDLVPRIAECVNVAETLWDNSFRIFRMGADDLPDVQLQKLEQYLVGALDEMMSIVLEGRTISAQEVALAHQMMANRLMSSPTFSIYISRTPPPNDDVEYTKTRNNRIAYIAGRLSKARQLAASGSATYEMGRRQAGELIKFLNKQGPEPAPNALGSYMSQHHGYASKRGLLGRLFSR